MARRRAKGDTKRAGMSAKRSQLLVDQEAWEDNRLIQSGIAELREVQTHFEDEEESRVTLIVHNLKPPFLDGRVSFSMQQEAVSILPYPIYTIYPIYPTYPIPTPLFPVSPSPSPRCPLYWTLPRTWR